MSEGNSHGKWIHSRSEEHLEELCCLWAGKGKTESHSQGEKGENHESRNQSNCTLTSASSLNKQREWWRKEVLHSSGWLLMIFQLQVDPLAAFLQKKSELTKEILPVQCWLA